MYLIVIIMVCTVIIFCWYQLIKTDMEFQRDMLLMFQNAFMYNSSDHDVFFMAQSMKSDVMENIQVWTVVLEEDLLSTLSCYCLLYRLT